MLQCADRPVQLLQRPICLILFNITGVSKSWSEAYDLHAIREAAPDISNNTRSDQIFSQSIITTKKKEITVLVSPYRLFDVNR